jgi:hypothetical protein
MSFSKQFCDKHDSETYVIENGCQNFNEINSWDLTVATCHKFCSENSNSFHSENPFIFDAPMINWDIFLINYFPKKRFSLFLLTPC